MFNRYIDVVTGNVWFNTEKFANCDCNDLAKLDVVKVIEDMSDIWVEREPFNGREYNIDFSIAYRLFEEAERKFNAELMAEKYRRADFLEPYKVLYAIYELNYDELWDAWVNSSERTFLERAYIQYHPSWDRKSSIIRAAFTGMGLTEIDIDRVWNLGTSYAHKPIFE